MIEWDTAYYNSIWIPKLVTNVSHAVLCRAMVYKFATPMEPNGKNVAKSEEVLN